jgi:hypothetical protein
MKPGGGGTRQSGCRAEMMVSYCPLPMPWAVAVPLPPVTARQHISLRSDAHFSCLGVLGALPAQMKLAVGALVDCPVRTPPAMLAEPLNQGAIGFDHLERMGTPNGHRESAG